MLMAARSHPRRPDPSVALAVIHNELARARYDLGIIALRLVMMLAERISYNDEELMHHRFKVADYAARLGVREKGSVYSQLEEVCQSLLRSLIETRFRIGERRQFQLMTLACYYDGEGEIELHFHPEMKPLLLSLREYFTQIPSHVFFRIRSAYAAKFYLVCKSWDPRNPKNKSPGWSWTVAELRHWLWLKPNEYTHTPHLRSAILERAKRELDETADVSFQYTTKREGRAIVGWDFVPVTNEPKQRRQARCHTPPLALAAPEEPLPAPDYTPEVKLWRQASLEQQAQLLEQNEALRLYAPQGDKPPRRAFLAQLREVLARQNEANPA
jgi:hypothetical protein